MAMVTFTCPVCIEEFDNYNDYMPDYIYQSHLSYMSHRCKVTVSLC